jgi:hypothetical protein
MTRFLLALPVLLLLSGCHDKVAKWKAECKRAHPDDPVKAEACLTKTKEAYDRDVNPANREQHGGANPALCGSNAPLAVLHVDAYVFRWKATTKLATPLSHKMVGDSGRRMS